MTFRLKSSLRKFCDGYMYYVIATRFTCYSGSNSFHLYASFTTFTLAITLIIASVNTHGSEIAYPSIARYLSDPCCLSSVLCGYSCSVMPMAVSLIGGGNLSTRKNHRPVASH